MRKKFLLFVGAIAIFALVSVNVNVAFNTDGSSAISFAKSQTALAASPDDYEYSQDEFDITGEGYDYCCYNGPNCTSPTEGHYYIETWYTRCYGSGNWPCEDYHYTHTQYRFACGCYCLH